MKTNVGHLEGCSGLVGLAKAVHFGGVVHGRYTSGRRTRPLIGLPLLLIAKRTSERCGGVSSFGFGGALGHVVVTGSREMRRRRSSTATRWSCRSRPLVEFTKSDVQTYKSMVAT